MTISPHAFAVDSLGHEPRRSQLRAREQITAHEDAGRAISGRSHGGDRPCGRVGKEIAPKTQRVAILSDPFTVDQLKMAEGTAPTFGLRIQPVRFQTLPYDYSAAFAGATKEGCGAALVTVGPVFFRDRSRLVEVAAQHRIPTMFPLPEFVDAGGLIAYGANLDATFASAASYIERILKGSKPADLPIEQPRSFELVVNMKTAKTIGVTIPPSVVLRADRVIE